MLTIDNKEVRIYCNKCGLEITNQCKIDEPYENKILVPHLCPGCEEDTEELKEQIEDLENELESLQDYVNDLLDKIDSLE